MPIATLVPTAVTDSNSNVAAGAYTDVDNTIASASGATLDSVTNEWTGSGTASAFTFTMSNLPSDAQSINTVQFRVRGRVTGTATTDLSRYTCDVSGSNAPTTTAKWGQGDAGGGFANRGATSAVTSLATVSEVNAWSVRVYQTVYSTEGAGDGLNLELDEVEIAVDYNTTAAAPPSDSPAGSGYTVIPTTDTAIYGTCMARVRDFVVMGGLNADRYSIRWSAISDPTDWPTPATDDARSKQSGSQSFPSEFGHVTGIAGDDFNMYVFQERAITRSNYVGGNVVFTFDTIFEGLGCKRQGRILKMDDRIFFQSARGFHMLINGQVVNIGFGKVDDSFSG